MKKITLILVACLLLTLCACGTAEHPTTTPTQQTQATTVPTSEATDPAGETTEATTAPTVSDAKALANSCMDKSVTELYALIGEPISTDYAPSCLGPGEDGMLFYDGFVVYTYRENGQETINYVE